ncbi:hypothetical protein [Meiothermus sp.]|uniref:hypothetical protein n=1 Tax=Meiothermus sp. TaxID=1955249 RepID=UPI00307F6BF3
MKNQPNQSISRLRSGFLLVAALLLSACGGLSGGPPAGGAADPGYIITVRVGASDTQEALAQKYGGTVLS